MLLKCERLKIYWDSWTWIDKVYMSIYLFDWCNVDSQYRTKMGHAQNMRIHISRHMRKISSGQFLPIEIFYSIPWFCLRTENALIRLRGCAGWSGPSLFAYARRLIFTQRGPNTDEKYDKKTSPNWYFIHFYVFFFNANFMSNSADPDTLIRRRTLWHLIGLCSEKKV